MLELHHARHSERREVDFLCEVVARDWDSPFRHRATDLSPTGAWLRTSFPLAVDAVVVLNLRPPGWNEERDLTVFARVARSVSVRERNGRRENGMGVRFLDITDCQRVALRRCLRRSSAGSKIHWSALADRLIGYA